MVRLVLALFVAALLPSRAFAVLAQTGKDLAVLEDSFRHRMETEPGLKNKIVPMLLAPPKNVWVESRDDFGSSALAVIKNVIPDAGTVIICPDCDTHRLHIQQNQSVSISNGELALGDIARLRQDPRFRAAKSVATVRETPSGVEMRVIGLDDGALLFFALADSSERLSDTKPYLHLSRELERRKFGESLAYIFLNLGAYPTGTFQLEYLEQWGSLNQHLSGVVLSLFSPTFALGATYKYMMPTLRKLNFNGTLFYPLQNAFGAGPIGEDDDDLTKKFVLQIGAQYAFSTTFGIFAIGNTDNTLSLGISLFNPLLMPFML